MKGDLKAAVPQRAISVTKAKVNAKQPPGKKLSAGDKITQTIMGKEVTFVLERIPTAQINDKTSVFIENEREQTLLDKHSLADIILTFEEYGQQVPAYGRKADGVIELADGSRRRKTAILTERDFLVLVAPLTDEQMRFLSGVGNDYCPISAFEKGMVWQRWLESGVHPDKAAIGKVVGKDRKIVERNINTASLPIELVKCFASPNEISGRQGDKLFKQLAKLNEQQRAEIDALFKTLRAEKNAEKPKPAADIIGLVESQCTSFLPASAEPVKRNIGKSAKLVIKGGNARLDIKGASDELLKRIEQVIHDQEQLDNI